MQGTVDGGRRKWRQKKRWEDNIREMTGLVLRNTLQIAEDSEEWKAMPPSAGLLHRGRAVPKGGPSSRISSEIETLPNPRLSQPVRPEINHVTISARHGSPGQAGKGHVCGDRPRG
ncbi:hypothetical protein ElyMa_002152200 [Elysia marginata]|uniref:Uncharacterized protein n=1 Tax=Elysia marginata TaxID=1093978 RepID=A0AAV4FL60_9GAST|nr:hypothetical protein ElyMa_002152200 [Elysia marginata]